MNTTEKPVVTKQRFSNPPFRVFNLRNVRRMLMCAAVLVTLVALFYTEENWRGKRAWEQFKQEAAARGISMDWNVACVPPAVPDDQNFFKAPHMQDWFVGRGANELTKRIDFGKLTSSLQQSNCVFAKVTIVPPDANDAPSDADIVLSFHEPKLLISEGPEDAFTNFWKPEILPVIAMDHVPLRDAITNLGNAAGLKFEATAKSINERGYVDIDAVPIEPKVIFHWTNITAREALFALLANYNLRMVPGFAGRPAGIIKKTSEVQMSPDVGTKLERLVYDRVQEVAGAYDAEHLTATLGFELSAKAVSLVRPLRVAVRCNWTPETEQVAKFFSRNAVGGIISVTHARQTGSNTFEVFADFPPRVAAEDYLKWTGQFQSDFNAISAALDRPYARMDGNYENPVHIPIPSFVCVRVCAQMLAMRAQCYLLLNHPDKALRELTLLHHMSRMLEARPTGRPMTLVAAMINVAIKGLYVSTIGDGFRLKAWHEPQLVALQQQLAETELMSHVHHAILFESQTTGRLADISTSKELADVFYTESIGATFWEKMKNSSYRAMVLSPRGWFYQAAVIRGRFDQSMLSDIDPAKQLFEPEKLGAGMSELEQSFDHHPFTSYFAALMIPNYSLAMETCGKNQTLVNQALIACALERYRLAHGQYPETLDALMPQYLEKLPHDLIGGAPLKYRREGDRFVLYSIGWNGKDDGGIPSPEVKNGGSQRYLEDLTKNDWVWPFQEPIKK